MTLVRIVKNWDWPDLLRQTPNRCGVWAEINFTLEPVEVCDYVIVLNGASAVTTVACPPEQVWSIPQEPPTGAGKFWHVNPTHSFRLFTSDLSLSGASYIHSHPALPWHVNRDYDFLVACPAPEKTRALSWITSNLTYLKGHRARLDFLAQIQGKVAFDLWGRGFTPIDDKWDGLIAYRYSLAVENYSNPFYWSEKLADCYLAWCMPIYYGCTRITDYFPAESLIQIDIHQPEAAIDKMKEAIANNAWRRNLDAIAYARELILNRYQFFPFITRQIQHFESTYGAFSQKQSITIAPRHCLALISVIICTYNRAALLAEALQTVCEQELDPTQYEVIVVDNNSTDDTPAVAHTFVQRYPNVRYCRETQQGLSHARNRGWQEAKGEYVAYLDDDCKAPANWLQVAQTIIQRQYPVEFGGPFLPYYNCAKPTWWRDAYDANHAGGIGRAAGYLPPGQEVFGGNLFLQRAIFTQIGGFNPTLGVNGNKLAYGEESELHVRLCAFLPEHRAYFDPQLSVNHLVRAEKLSLWWQLRSVVLHGRAGYTIAPQRYRAFTRRERLLFPLYGLKTFGLSLFRSWFRRDRTRYPAWQNYLYEANDLSICLSRLGNWFAYTQAQINSARGKRDLHAR